MSTSTSSRRRQQRRIGNKNNDYYSNNCCNRMLFIQCLLLPMITYSLTASTTFVATALLHHDVRLSAWIVQRMHFLRPSSSSSSLYMIDETENNSNNKRNISKKLSREIEIRRQIQELKQQGKIKKTKTVGGTEMEERDDSNNNNNDNILYQQKIRQKLGNRKSKFLGFTSTTDDVNSDEDFDDDDDNDDDDNDNEFTDTQKAIQQQNVNKRIGQIGALTPTLLEDTNDDGKGDDIGGYLRQKDDGIVIVEPNTAISMIEDDEQEEEEELSEDDLVDLVAQKLAEKPFTTNLENTIQRSNPTLTSTTVTMDEASSARIPKTTTGIGGSWDKGQESEATQDVYQPKTGSWGAFPRPRDISKAYGGGRRVGVGYTETSRISNVDETRQRLQRYRMTVGIDVESEKIHAQEIDEAMKVATYAMQRGVYTSAVSSLEKITKHCSTNSKVGGKVFLELAMAYEAAGQTQEAITVYTTLTRSRNEEVASTSKRLLYGIEAIKFMQDNVGSAEFSRKQAKTTFIDTTGLDNFARNFDDVYETAYIDMDKDFYKQLTEAVVRTSREARQILIRATQPGEISRLRIVQALRSLSRYFDDALQNEIELMKPLPEPVAVMDGKPIVPIEAQRQRLSSKIGGVDLSTSSRQLDEYTLMDAPQMIENLDGEWQLQLITDKRGDGVKFFNNNTSLVWQVLDTSGVMKFTSYCTQGIFTIEPSGQLDFNNKRRILRRRYIETTGAGKVITNIFGGLTLGSKTGPIGAICTERQVIMVDSTLLVTRGVPSTITTTKFGTTITTRATRKEDEKDYFAVWRRVEPGTYSR